MSDFSCQRGAGGDRVLPDVGFRSCVPLPFRACTVQGLSAVGELPFKIIHFGGLQQLRSQWR